MAYHTEWPVNKRIEELPYKIIPIEVEILEIMFSWKRAIVGERLQTCYGITFRSAIMLLCLRYRACRDQGEEHITHTTVN